MKNLDLTASPDQDELLDKLLAANSLEQSGSIEEAKILYQELITLDGEGAYGLSAKKALDALGGYVPQSPSSVVSADNSDSVPSQPKTTRWKYLTGLPIKLRQRWENFSFSTKLTLVFIGGAVFPVLIATQVFVLLTQNSFQRDFKQKLHSNAAAWESDYILQARDDSQAEAENLAHLVEAQANTLNPEDEKAVLAQKYYQLTLVREATSASDTTRPQLTKSFRILTDASGQSVAQSAKLHTEAATNKDGYPMLPDPSRLVNAAEFRAFETPPGIKLGDLDIVKTALQTGQPQKGVEIVSWAMLNSLGLGEQAAIGLRGYAKGTPIGEYRSQLDDYQAGLVSMAVYPVQVNNRIVGTTIVGVLLNRNYALTDYFRKLYDVPIVSIYAYNWEVNTTAPYTDDRTRAIGKLTSKEVTDVVLNQGKELLLKENIQGVDYLTLYKPVYNYQQQVNAAEAKPIGMIAVGRAETEVVDLLVKQQVLGWTIASAMLLLVIIVANPIAKALTSSLRNLAEFAQQVSKGETGMRLVYQQADEIGILSRELNDMAISIEVNMKAVQSQEELRRQDAEQQRREKEYLQQGVLNLLLEIEGAKQGDLTVNAPVTEGAIGSIADAFNTTVISLRNLVLQVQTGANQVSDLAQESTASMQQLSQEATVQAREINRALTTVTKIVELIRQVDDSAQEAAAIAQQGANAAQEGETVMELTVKSIDNIQTAVVETAHTVDRLTEACHQISQILTIISSISERTNVLAYNASIEAARAGEHGQGFRIVAEEVRRLAQRVTDATKNIEKIVETIQQETAAAHQSMAAGTAEVVSGTELVTKTKQTLQKLADISKKIDRYLQSISQNTMSCAAGSQQVNEMISQVATITEHTSTEAENVSQSLQDLVTVATNLQTSVAKFRVEK